MLCRALFAVAVVSYVLCVLLLSGVQKDDLDAGTLRKLQRHNVNIADIDGKIRDECFANKNVASTAQQAELKIKPTKSTTSPTSTELRINAGPSPAELKKILDYIKQKESHKEFNLEEATTKSNVIQHNNMIDLSKLPSSVQSRVMKEIAGLSTTSTINRVTTHNNKKVKTNHDDYEQSDDLQNIEKVQQEHATQIAITNKPITDKLNDVEYISKIVAQILARRKFSQESTTTAPPTTAYFDGNKLAQEIRSILTKNLIDKYPQNFYLNNFNASERVESLPIVEPKKKTEEKDIIDAVISQLRNRDKLQPHTNTNNEYINNNQINKLIETEDHKNALYSHLGDINNPNVIDSSKNEAIVGNLLLDKWQSEITSGKTKNVADTLPKQQTSTFNLRSGLDRTVSIQEVISKHFPYFFEGQNKQETKIGSRVNCLIVNQPDDLCKIRNNNEIYPDNDNKSIWPYILERLSKGELTLQDMQKIPPVYWPNDSKIKSNSQNSEIKNDLSLDNQYKGEWLFEGSSVPIQFQLKNNQNPIQVPLNNNDLTMEGKSKNSWSYYYEDPKLKQQDIPVSKNILLHDPNQSEKSVYNQRLISNAEAIGVKPKNCKKSPETVQQLIIGTNKIDPEYMIPNKNDQLYVINEQSKEDPGKVNSIPPGMIKQIADSVKEIVLRDLKKVISSTTNAATTVSTTTTRPTTTTTVTTITTPATTPTTTTKPTSTTTPTSTIITTTENPSTTVKEDHVKIQEASKALEKFMEIFERFKSMKDSNVDPGNVTHKAKMNDNRIVNKGVKNENPQAYPLYPPPYIRNQMKRQPLILDPYTDESTPEQIQIQNKVTKKPHGYALTLQTNSDEIPPLNVAVSKPLSMLNNIVVTPLPEHSRGRNLRPYSAEASRNRKPQRYQVPRADYQPRYNLSKNNYREPREPGNFKYGHRPKARINKKERNFKDQAYKQRDLHVAERFHEKLERADTWQRHSPGDKCSVSKENRNEPVASRMQRPLVNSGSSYDDTHFRNFLKTQQKVTDMLERILATNVKHIPRSAEIL